MPMGVTSLNPIGGASVFCADKDNNTPFHIAAKLKSPALMFMLLKGDAHGHYPYIHTIQAKNQTRDVGPSLLSFLVLYPNSKSVLTSSIHLVFHLST